LGEEVFISFSSDVTRYFQRLFASFPDFFSVAIKFHALTAFGSFGLLTVVQLAYLFTI
jgi:hypothetical protein